MSLRSADTLALRKDFLNNGNWPRNKDFQKIINECVENIVGPVCMITHLFLVLSPLFWKERKSTLSGPFTQAQCKHFFEISQRKLGRPCYQSDLKINKCHVEKNILKKYIFKVEQEKNFKFKQPFHMEWTSAMNKHLCFTCPKQT